MEKEVFRRDFLKLLFFGASSAFFLSNINCINLKERLSPKITEKQKDKKINIYLTIDDGPRKNMEKILENLGKDNYVTFFVIGEKLKKSGNFYKACKALELGHEIGNHSYKHPAFSKISIDRAKREIEKADKLIDKVYEKVGKENPKFFRFPFGNPGYYKKHGKTISEIIGCKNSELLKFPYEDPLEYDLKGSTMGSGKKRKEIALFLKEMGYSTYFWSLDTEDWEYYGFGKPLLKIIKNAEKAKKGDIILTHDLSITAKHIIPFYVNSNKYNLKTLKDNLNNEYRFRKNKEKQNY